MRKRTKRKVYPVLSGLEVVAFRNSKPNAETTEHVRFTVFTALENLRIGRMDRDSWDHMAHAINAARLLAMEKKLGQEYMPQLDAARDALVAVGRRAVENNLRFVARAEELQALRAFAEIHDAQLEVANAGDTYDVSVREAELLRTGVVFAAKPKP